MAKLNNFRGFARNISEPTHNRLFTFMKIFNSKRKIPIFHNKTSKTEIDLKADQKHVNDQHYGV